MKKVLLGVSGSIAAYKACDIINRLKERDIEVTVVVTDNALEFIPELTLRTLSENEVYTTVFNKENPKVSHIDIVKNSDLFLIAPATANILGKLANGICDDMLSTMFMVAKDKPIIIAPAMNTNMYENQINQANISKLKKYGVKFIEPRNSQLACGDFGKGALATVEDIVNYVIANL